MFISRVNLEDTKILVRNLVRIISITPKRTFNVTFTRFLSSINVLSASIGPSKCSPDSNELSSVRVNRFFGPGPFTITKNKNITVLNSAIPNANGHRNQLWCGKKRRSNGFSALGLNALLVDGL